MDFLHADQNWGKIIFEKYPYTVKQISVIKRRRRKFGIRKHALASLVVDSIFHLTFRTHMNRIYCKYFTERGIYWKYFKELGNQHHKKMAQLKFEIQLVNFE